MYIAISPTSQKLNCFNMKHLVVIFHYKNKDRIFPQTGLEEISMIEFSSKLVQRKVTTSKLSNTCQSLSSNPIYGDELSTYTFIHMTFFNSHVTCLSYCVILLKLHVEGHMSPHNRLKEIPQSLLGGKLVLTTNTTEPFLCNLETELVSPMASD